MPHSSPPAPRGTELTPPPPFPLLPRTPSAFKSRRPPTSLPFFSIFFPICSAHHCLPAPPPSLSALSPVASLPHQRESEPSSASTFRPLGEPGPPCVMARKWCAPHLLPSPPVLRTPPLAPPMTGAPSPLWDIAAPPPLRPRTSSRCSGEPSPLLLIRHIVVALTVLTPPILGHHVHQSTRASRPAAARVATVR
jgi:hypothetical protein